jgi:rRNA maturation RNase YbeY
MPTNVISFSYKDDLSCVTKYPQTSLKVSTLKVLTRNVEQIRFQKQALGHDARGEIMGDIAISLERAKEEAEGTGRHFYERVFALIIHGILHVLGFDHECGKNESRKMRYREKMLLDYVRSHELYKILVVQDL